ncbi:MAG TPA: 4-alpha-glucanotransferase [Actinoplanes sp.]|nr:4-alpha-glucanotransferase [Actinoplanes sp.]
MTTAEHTHHRFDVRNVVPGEAPGADRADLAGLTTADALEQIWTATRHDQPAEFQTWTDEQGTGLTLFATWCVLAGIHGPDWRSWPARYNHPLSPAVATFTREHADRVRFHMWCQWVADRQVAAAGAVPCRDADEWQYQEPVSR